MDATTIYCSTPPNLMSPQCHSHHPLHLQRPTHASAATKIRLSMLATAIVDALGGPGEFHQRFGYPFIDSMIPNSNFDLPPGVWTDDTSMMLCLAQSITTCTAKDGFDHEHQMEIYKRWYKEGHLSATGVCFDIGNTIRYALDTYCKHEIRAQTPLKTSRMKTLLKSFKSAKDDVVPPWREIALADIRESLDGDVFSGNGSLMRLLPIPLAYFNDPRKASLYARWSSETTHPSAMCVELCDVWTRAIVNILQASTRTPSNKNEEQNGDKKTELTKLGILEHFATYPYRHKKLRKAFGLPKSHPAPPAPPPGTPRDLDELESFYREYHPILKRLAKMQLLQDTEESTSHTKPRSDDKDDSGAQPVESNGGDHSDPQSQPAQTTSEGNGDPGLQSDSNGNIDAHPDPEPNEEKDEPKSEFDYLCKLIPSATKLPSTGFIVHTAAAALYCFFATETFEEGALMAVNLGFDTDTVGAVYAGLAAVWYAHSEDEVVEESHGSEQKEEETNGERELGGGEGKRGRFWSERVKSWRDGILKRDVVEEIAEEVVKLMERFTPASNP
ncbi:hypothetical protein AX17_001489 [Amanita inopinata Kibby_2008]|nr:hypothetical protein AX17_001489 [Amanita inopinata Kibby_2008]